MTDDRTPKSGAGRSKPAAVDHSVGDSTKPLVLPARDAATPPDGVPTAEPSDASTKPLEMPHRPPGPIDDRPITVQLVEEDTGVLTMADDRPAGISAAAEKIAAEKAAARRAAELAEERPITVELVEENTGVLTVADDKPAELSAAAEKIAAEKAADAVDTKAAAAAVDADAIAETVTSTEDTTTGPDEDMVPWVAPEDGFQLADEIGMAPPAPAVPRPPVLASPKEAALETARIVSEMVDIDSESGAVIAAAAAAGAAIEAAVAAQKTLDPHTSQPSVHASELAAAAASSSSDDAVTTTKLSRDRILAALATEEAAAPASPARETSSRLPRAPGEGRVRPHTEPGIDEDAYEELDPVAIAAAAIGRLRQRARTDLAELRGHYQRHDILVLLLALVIIVVAGRLHRDLVTPQAQTFEQRGLTFAHPTTLLRPEPIPLVAPRLLRDPTGGVKRDANVYHVELASVGSTSKLEVLIDKKPAWSNIVTGLELDRRSRWGELYTLDDSSVRSIAGHDWLRTAYRYAHIAEHGDVPRVDRAVEYATIDREQIYVVTIHGTPAEIEQIEGVVAPSLRVPSQSDVPLVPQTSRLGQRTYPGPVGRAFDSTVMVVVADLVDGRLQARGGGSGVIVGADGSILTNYHVLQDESGDLHDVFVIGRFSALDRAPRLTCAGRPSRSKLQPELDLALVKCDMDLDGRTWSPGQGGIWATLPEAQVSDIQVGQRLWVLGYPEVGGGGLTLGAGKVEGWTGEDGAPGTDYIETDASITHGNSGGPVIDDRGKLVGIASGFRTRITSNDSGVEMAQVGLVRPLQSASNLLAYATAGWTPREGATSALLAPTTVEAAAEGIRIFTTVLDDANEQPVRDATVIVLRPGISASAIDMNRLDEQAIAWGKSNTQGEVRLKQLVPNPGTYTVMVVAPGYEPLIGEDELHLAADTPPNFDPWGRIGLRSR